MHTEGVAVFRHRHGPEPEHDRVDWRFLIANLQDSGVGTQKRERYCRIQLVFDGDAPDHTFRAAGVVRQQRRGRVLTAICSGNIEPIAAEARALGASSVEIMPVPLKEIFLETVNGDN